MPWGRRLVQDVERDGTIFQVSHDANPLDWVTVQSSSADNQHVRGREELLDLHFELDAFNVISTSTQVILVDADGADMERSLAEALQNVFYEGVRLLIQADNPIGFGRHDVAFLRRTELIYSITISLISQ